MVPISPTAASKHRQTCSPPLKRRATFHEQKSRIKHRRGDHSHVYTHHDNPTPLLMRSPIRMFKQKIPKKKKKHNKNITTHKACTVRRRFYRALRGCWAPGAVRAGFSSSFSCAVAATLCGMEDGCACTATGCDFSRWPF